MGSSKKAPAPKKDQLAAVHSASAALKSAQALQTAKATKAPGPAPKAPGPAPKAPGPAPKAPPPAPKAPGPAPTETGFTHHLPTKAQIAANGRRPGRNLVLWQRKFHRIPSPLCSLGLFEPLTLTTMQVPAWQRRSFIA